LAFIPESWPEAYRNDLLVSYHGSWNRSTPTGYKVARFDLNEQYTAEAESDFIAGWLVGNGALGRPVGLLFGHDDALYISDDKSGTIYRAVPVALSGK
jgi:glucose/arabinose dehydrogenase